ncbi:MAG: hypothetical protein ABIP78_12205 [Pyrinomonadaceae bacterium]
MLQNTVLTVFIFLFSGVSGLVFAQTPEAAIRPTYIAGDVTAIGARSIVITTKTGQSEVILTEKTAFKRASAENMNPATATPGVLADVGVGDKVTVSALLASDGKSMNARTVYFVTKADIAAKNAKDAAEWQKRGIMGRVVKVDPQTNQINVELRSLTGSSNVTLTPKESAKFLRYAQDSIRFDEAKDSSIAEVKAGDMLRALGDRSADGMSFSAEKVVTGAFQTVAGTVKSIDAAKNEVLIKNLQTGKDVTVVIGDTSVLKRFPAEMAEQMARLQIAGAGGPRPAGQGPAQPATPGASGQAPGAERGFGGQRPAGSIEDMLDRFPNITSVDLKVGDIIALSSTKNVNMDRIKAIKLIAGVEPFLRAAQATGVGQRGQGVQAGINIPGLDGVSFP